MVRLKENFSQFELAWTSLFQFHYGTIKSLIRANISNILPRFQFHYGTIKSIDTRGYPYVEIAFQFHYGTIKSFMKLYIYIIIILHFNSTMVRLKAVHHPEYCSFSFYFNSTMVRLKDYTANNKEK